MGMPCQVNSILKLSRQDFPALVTPALTYQVTKQGYRIIPMDVPLPLVDENWLAHADIVIRKLTWESNATSISFTIQRVYPTPFSVKIE
jgi:Protein of unknown function (DUF2584)